VVRISSPGSSGRRADHRVQRRGRVLGERERLDVGADELRKLGPHLVEQPLEPAGDQLDGIALELALPVLVDVEHGSWARPVAAVIEEREARIEQVVGRHLASQCPRARVST